MKSCDCDSYSDLKLDTLQIKERVPLFRSMRAKLDQIGSKLVERWLEHYRLYRCGECEQYWQASLAPSDSDTWYLYKVPYTTIFSWKLAPFVPPDAILSYLANRDVYIENDFDLGDQVCTFEDCTQLAIAGLRKCHYHQFLEIGGQGTLDWLGKFTWHAPYDPAMVDFTG